MNNQVLLNSMMKQHKEVFNNLNKLEDLELKCKTELGKDKDKKIYNKLLKQTNKTYSILSKSYKMILNQKLEMPKEFIEIGLEIEDMGKQLKNFKEL